MQVHAHITCRYGVAYHLSPARYRISLSYPKKLEVETFFPMQFWFLVTRRCLLAGVLFLQQTDATGKTKNAEFLSADYISAIEKAGDLIVVRKMLPDGNIITKKKSPIVKLLITDRGGGCVNALHLTEAAMVILADTCKGHGADLLIEDWAKPFKGHIKNVCQRESCVHPAPLFSRPSFPFPSPNSRHPHSAGAHPDPFHP